jgi:hypothetical protein
MNASRASMASIAETNRSEEEAEFLDEGFSPRAVQCFITPDASPKGSSEKQSPARLAKV